MCETNLLDSIYLYIQCTAVLRIGGSESGGVSIGREGGGLSWEDLS